MQVLAMKQTTSPQEQRLESQGGLGGEGKLLSRS
jgi:hypothetical protein